MPKLFIPKDYILRDRKLDLLLRLAALDVDSAIAPTDRVPQDREALLHELRQVDAEFDAIGSTADERDVISPTEAQWRFDDEEP